MTCVLYISAVMVAFHGPVAVEPTIFFLNMLSSWQYHYGCGEEYWEVACEPSGSTPLAELMNNNKLRGVVNGS